MTKRKFNYILLVTFFFFQIVNCMSANLLEGFVHLENAGIIFDNFFRVLSFTGFLWIIIGLLYEKKEASLNAFYFVMPATVLELSLSYFYFSIHPIELWEIIIYFISNIITIICTIVLYLQTPNKKYSMTYFKHFIYSVVLFIPLNFLHPLVRIMGNNKFWNFKLFGIWHILFLLAFIGFAILLEKYLKKFNKEQRYFIILGLALILFFKLLCRFSFVRVQDYQNVKGFMGALPFYVCSFGMLLLPFAIFSRSRVFQGILFLVNMPGAIIVLVNPSTGPTNIFHYNVMYFFVTHIMLFGITMMLPIYLEGKPNRQIAKVTGLVLAVYFIFMVGLNSIAINLSKGINPNFSFVSESPLPIPIDKIMQITIYKVTFSPIYLLLLWLVQYGISLITYFIYKNLTKNQYE